MSGCDCCCAKFLAALPSHAEPPFCPSAARELAIHGHASLAPGAGNGLRSSCHISPAYRKPDPFSLFTSPSLDLSCTRGNAFKYIDAFLHPAGHVVEHSFQSNLVTRLVGQRRSESEQMKTNRFAISHALDVNCLYPSKYFWDSKPRTHVAITEVPSRLKAKKIMTDMTE